MTVGLIKSYRRFAPGGLLCVLFLISETAVR
jgi:hypothetical protein